MQKIVLFFTEFTDMLNREILLLKESGIMGKLIAVCTHTYMHCLVTLLL